MEQQTENNSTVKNGDPSSANKSVPEEASPGKLKARLSTINEEPSVKENPFHFTPAKIETGSVPTETAKDQATNGTSPHKAKGETTANGDATKGKAVINGTSSEKQNGEKSFHAPSSPSSKACGDAISSNKKESPTSTPGKQTSESEASSLSSANVSLESQTVSKLTRQRVVDESDTEKAKRAESPGADRSKMSPVTSDKIESDAAVPRQTDTGSTSSKGTSSETATGDEKTTVSTQQENDSKGNGRKHGYNGRGRRRTSTNERDGKGRRPSMEEREGKGQRSSTEEREGKGRRPSTEEREGKGQRSSTEEREGKGQRSSTEEREGKGQRPSTEEREGKGQRSSTEEREGKGRRQSTEEREGKGRRQSTEEGHERKHLAQRRRSYSGSKSKGYKPFVKKRSISDEDTSKASEQTDSPPGKSAEEASTPRQRKRSYKTRQRQKPDTKNLRQSSEESNESLPQEPKEQDISNISVEDSPSTDGSSPVQNLNKEDPKTSTPKKQSSTEEQTPSHEEDQKHRKPMPRRLLKSDTYAVRRRRPGNKEWKSSQSDTSGSPILSSKESGSKSQSSVDIESSPSSLEKEGKNEGNADSEGIEQDLQEVKAVEADPQPSTSSESASPESNQKVIEESSPPELTEKPEKEDEAIVQPDTQKETVGMDKENDQKSEVPDESRPMGRRRRSSSTRSNQEKRAKKKAAKKQAKEATNAEKSPEGEAKVDKKKEKHVAFESVDGRKNSRQNTVQNVNGNLSGTNRREYGFQKRQPNPVLSEVARDYGLTPRFVFPEESKILVAGKGYFFCNDWESRKHCSHWVSNCTWVLFDLRSMTVSRRYKQGCQKCSGMVIPRFEQESFIEMCHTVTKMYLSKVLRGSIYKPRRRAISESSHFTHMCERCQELNGSCVMEAACQI